jgi:hypothetical protein
LLSQVDQDEYKFYPNCKKAEYLIFLLFLSSLYFVFKDSKYSIGVAAFHFVIVSIGPSAVILEKLS